MAAAFAHAPAQHADAAFGEVQVDVHAPVATNQDGIGRHVEPEDLRAASLVESLSVAAEAVDLSQAAADRADRLRGHVGAAEGVHSLPLQKLDLRRAEPLVLGLRRREGDLLGLELERPRLRLRLCGDLLSLFGPCDRIGLERRPRRAGALGGGLLRLFHCWYCYAEESGDESLRV